jgi:hypothetical protein
MSKVVAIEPEDYRVAVRLECGHTDYWMPFQGWTMEQYIAHIQEGHRPLVIGKTRLRCNNKHE